MQCLHDSGREGEIRIVRSSKLNESEKKKHLNLNFFDGENVLGGSRGKKHISCGFCEQQENRGQGRRQERCSEDLEASVCWLLTTGCKFSCKCAYEKARTFLKS